jgi:outer membrane lipoprotein SlyB
MRMKFKGFFAVSALALLAGCQQPGANLAANVYTADQVNQSQDAKMINILSLSPAKVQASNTQNQQTAETVTGVLGAVAGGLLAAELGGSRDAMAGAALGGVAGAAAGSLTGSTALVDAVTIGYTEDGNLHTSTQVGEMCQFKEGQALVVITQANETRVQPNSTCPTPNNG